MYRGILATGSQRFFLFLLQRVGKRGFVSCMPEPKNLDYLPNAGSPSDPVPMPHCRTSHVFLPGIPETLFPNLIPGPLFPKLYFCLTKTCPSMACPYQLLMTSHSIWNKSRNYILGLECDPLPVVFYSSRFPKYSFFYIVFLFFYAPTGATSGACGVCVTCSDTTDHGSCWAPFMMTSRSI